MSVYLACSKCNTKHAVCVYEKGARVRECFNCGEPFNDSVVAAAIDLNNINKYMTKLKSENKNGAVIVLEIEE